VKTPAKKIKTLQEESNRQTYQMVEKLNEFLAETKSVCILMQQHFKKNWLKTCFASGILLRPSGWQFLKREHG
jgi:hypothetical protein